MTPRLLGVAGVAALGAMLGCSTRPKQSLEVLGTVAPFSLVSETGQPFDSHTLDGHIWVADFFFTTCTGPCPMMSASMRRLQDLTAAEFPDLRLVSFTVDPAHDTPQVLAEYARRYKRDPNRWFFLTGPQPALDTVSLKTFKLQSIDGSLTHSTRFALVDAQQRIRGYYVSGEEGFLPRLVEDVRRLSREKT